jgi:hypothetical protein
MRQSAGNREANKLSATSPAQETIEGPLATVSACVARVRSALLLKTTSRRLEGALGAPARRIPFQYNDALKLMQCAHVSALRSTFLIEAPCAQCWAQDSPSLVLRRLVILDEATAGLAADDRNARNNRRSVPAAGKAGEAHISRMDCAIETRTHPGFHSDGIEIR